MPRFLPIPDPCGALDPPRRPPPTALGTMDIPPEPAPFDMVAYRQAMAWCAELLRRFQRFERAIPFLKLRRSLLQSWRRVARAIGRLPEL